jgi:hypothetical protein
MITNRRFLPTPIAVPSRHGLLQKIEYSQVDRTHSGLMHKIPTRNPTHLFDVRSGVGDRGQGGRHVLNASSPHFVPYPEAFGIGVDFRL